MEYPKILIISHNPFSDLQSNGKTLSAFFDGWPKDNIAQLFLTPDRPDFTVCEKFYRITDLDVLKNFFKKVKCGSEITKENIISNEKEILHKNKIYVLVRNLFLKRLPIMYCVRNMVWQKVKPWRRKEVEEWINNFNPDVVFFQSSNVHSVFDMVKEICTRFNTRLFMETTDDYVTRHFSIDPFYLYDINQMIKKYKMLVKKSECVFAIGDMMAEEYKERFGGNYKVAMNSINVSRDVLPYDKVKNETIKILYAGNLGLNRWRILEKIGKALQNLNKKGVKAKLDIYSINRPSNIILKRMNIKDVAEYKGSLNNEEIIRERNSCDILLHVESFDKKNKYITRLSISTKIPECLLSERCLVVVGPNDIASVNYIEKNKIGKIIGNMNHSKLEKELEEIINNREKRIEYINNGRKIANKRHSFNQNKQLVQELILKKK